MSGCFRLNNLKLNVVKKLIGDQRLLGKFYVILSSCFFFQIIVINVRNLDSVVSRTRHITNVPSDNKLRVCRSASPKMDVCKHTRIIIRVEMNRLQSGVIVSCIPPLVNIIGIGKNCSSYKFHIQRTCYFACCLFHSAMFPGKIWIKVMAVVWHVIDDVPDDDLCSSKIRILLSCSFVIRIDYGTKQVVLIIGHSQITIGYR